MVVIPGESLAQYQVFGLVEFSYQDYEAKIGGQTVSAYSSFTQIYNAGIATSIWDPRFLIAQGNVGYTKTTFTGGANDSTGLNYGLNMNFFSRSRVSWDLYGRKNTTTVQGQSFLSGYDMISSSYGGTMNIRLAHSNGTRNNNQNNNNNNNGNNFSNNNNNNNQRSYIPLPDIRLSQDHSELESFNAITPIHQTRNDSKATIQYRLRNTDLTLDGMLEKFSDHRMGAAYETKSVNFDSLSRVTRQANLGITARVMDRNTANVSGYNPNENAMAAGARLEFSERAGLQHYYRYDSSVQENTNAKYVTSALSAGLTYRILPEVSLHSGLNYGVADYRAKDGALQSDYLQKNVGGFGGVSYGATFRPEYLDPFMVHANYDFRLGYSTMDTQASGADQTSGLNYTNTAGAGIASTGWKTETLGADVTFTSRRDHAASGSDLLQQSYSLNASTIRIPKTSVRFSFNYNVLDSTVRTSNVFVQQSSSLQMRRSAVLHLDADYTATPNLTLSAGMSRDRSIAAVHTLSTLADLSTYGQYFQTLYYGAANFNYMLTRRLQYRAELREEYRIDEFNNSEVNTQRLNMYLDYRIRMILVGLEYHLQQDLPNDNLPRFIQQQYVAKISRPF